MNSVCQYCKKEFLKETSLLVHLCEPRRRVQEQTERGVELGLQAYLKFYTLTQGSAKLKTFADFADSSYYRAFVKFGRYCVSIKAINPERFIEWLLKQNKKLHHWCHDRVYSEYLVAYLQSEAVVDALARAIEFSIGWNEATNNPSHDYLRYGNSNAISYAISTGRISPWIIYNSDSGRKFLSDLNVEQVSMIWSYIDSDFWKKKFRDYPADAEYAKEILAQAGW